MKVIEFLCTQHCFLLSLTSCISAAHLLLLLARVDVSLLTKVHTLFRYSSFLPAVLFLLRDLIHDPTSSQVLRGCDSSSDFCCFW